METADSTAGDGDAEEREDIQCFMIVELFENFRNFRSVILAGDITVNQNYRNTYRHKEQAQTENRVQSCNNLVDGHNCCQEVIEQNNDQQNSQINSAA